VIPSDTLSRPLKLPLALYGKRESACRFISRKPGDLGFLILVGFRTRTYVKKSYENNQGKNHQTYFLIHPATLETARFDHWCTFPSIWHDGEPDRLHPSS
jgi:hypothetical protein